MNNAQNDSSGSSNVTTTNQNKGSKSGSSSPQGRSQNTPAGQTWSQSGQSMSGDNIHLDQFLSYVKENWKIILSELVAAGVTAYLTYAAKEKAGKTSSKENLV